MLLRCEHLQIKIQNRVLIDDFSSTVVPREWISILGPSGLGKTHLLRSLYGDRSIDGGHVAADPARNMLFQNHPVVGSLSALENVLLADLPTVPWWRTILGPPRRDPAREQKAMELLSELGLSDKAHRTVKSFSGGEKARVLIARFALASPRLLLADEPTASLDRDSALIALKMLKREICGNGGSVICVLHHPELARLVSDRLWIWDENLLKPREVTQ